MITRLSNVLRFVYEFLFGDDPLVTLGVVAALVVAATIARNTTMPAWWIAVLAVLILLPLSIASAARTKSATRRKRKQI